MAGQYANNTDLFEAYFKRADLDGDGQISGAEAVAFFQGSNLPKQVLAKVWSHADQRKAGFLNRAEFFNALKLVTVAQSKRELTPDIVKAALYGPASDRIPAPQINLAATPSPHPRVGAPAPQSSGAPSTQNVGVRGPQDLGNASTNQRFFPSQPNQFIRPPQAMPPDTASHPQQVLSGQSTPSGGSMAVPRPSTSNVSTDWLGGSTSSPLAGATTQVSSRGVSPSSAQDGLGLPASSLAPSVQLRPPATSAQTPATAPKTQDPDSKALVVSGNGFPSDSLFGDVFSASPVQPKQDLATSSAVSLPVSTAIAPASSASEPSVKPSSVEPLQHAFSQQPMGGQYQQGQSAGKQNQQFAVKSTSAPASAGFPVGSVNSASIQSRVAWPKMTQSEVQKYTKVFVQVDTDRDGKITGEQARNLFLSWRLPREVLKQVWELSDQDNDSMLSLKEFCTALYLMERYREGHTLPAMLPSTILSDEALFSTIHPQVPHSSGTWGPIAGFQPHASRPPTGKPPRPVPVAQADRTVQPTLQKPKVPELEKHLADQLSKEEQDSLNAKLKEATEADKKVEELEKEILTSREKIQFYHTKMQELILYKSRCDNRLNEITERVSGDKHEVELLAKKYEEKFKQSGDVASKLTLEEATFRDIQEKKMELYQAIVKMEGDNGDGTLQQRTDHIQKELEELVKNLNELCKQYGLRAKPTSLVELPFGWQPGIQEGSADWDEDWDKLEDEGFTFVKELTLDAQNVVAPPKQKSSSVQKETTSTNDDANASSSNTAGKSEKDASKEKDASEEKGASKEKDTSEVKDASKGEDISENEPAYERNEGGLARVQPGSPAGISATEKQSKEVQDSQIIKDAVVDGSPRAKETQSDPVGPESAFSGDKGFDEPSWGSFDTHYDTESVWGFDTDNAKETDHDRHLDSSMFGLDDFNIKPIKTEPSLINNLFQGKSSSIFADSVPSTPAYSITNSPRRFSAGPDDYSFDKGKSSSIFADSVPSSPANNFGNSPQKLSGGSEGHSFDNFSRFDSFNTHDGGLFQSPRHSLSRFDSVHSTRDSDPSFGLSSRFDSFNAHDSGFFQSQNSLARFDSMRSTKDFDHGHGFPAFETFDDTDPFGSTGAFKTSVDTPKKGSGVLAFDDTDPFGSTGPFKTTLESNTPKKSSDNWNAF